MCVLCVSVVMSRFELMEKINSELRKGTWTPEEDNLLRTCVQKYGEGKWHLVPQRAGLKRCRKSCRMRWLNYLKPNIRRGSFTDDEVDMIHRFHKLLGNRWSLIAGRLPGRTANDVKNFWHTNMRHNNKEEEEEENERKKVKIKEEEKGKAIKGGHVVIKPQPHTFSQNSPWLRKNNNNCNKLVPARASTSASTTSTGGRSHFAQPSPLPAPADSGKSESDEWWESLLNMEGDDDIEGQYGNFTMMKLFDQHFLQM